MIKRYVVWAIAAVLSYVAIGCASFEERDALGFTVRIENVSNTSELATPFAPGFFTVHNGDLYLFKEGQSDMGAGLESLAEDGNPATLAESLVANSMITQTGVFNTPSDMENPGPLLAGAAGAYEFTFKAAQGERLSFALMFMQSNDLFFAPQAKGIDLFPGGRPRSGDISDMIRLWDAGTEVNEAPGAGSNQVPRQSGPNVGPDENGMVRGVDDGFVYPPTTQLIRVTIDFEENENR